MSRSVIFNMHVINDYVKYALIKYSRGSNEREAYDITPSIVWDWDFVFTPLYKINFSLPTTIQILRARVGLN